MTLLDFGRTPGEYFSDKEEWPASTNRASGALVDGDGAGKALRLAYDVREIPELGYQYAGVSFPLDGASLRGYEAIAFDVRLLGGKPPRIRAELSAGHPKARQGVGLDMSDLGPAWTRFRIPVRRFTKFAAEGAVQPDSLALVVVGHKGEVEIRPLAAERADEGFQPLRWPVRDRASLPKGNGAWCYEDMGRAARSIAAFNARASANHKIRYAFAWGGELSVRGGRPVLNLDLKHPLKLSELLKGSEVRVFAIVDGVSFGSEFVKDRDWDRTGLELARAVDAEAGLAGLHLDIEPHSDDLHALYAAFKRHSPKPLSAAMGEWGEDTFRCLDLPVLMGYDLAKTPAEFRKAASGLYGRFMTDVRAAHATALIGIPAIATHMEYEGVSDTEDGPIRPTGHRMADFVGRALEAMREAAPGEDPACLGASIWALSTPGGLHNAGDTQWFHPTDIPDSLLMRLAGD